jgi:PAS domain S-box-containing protein
MVEGVRNYAILTLDPQGSVISWTDAAERLKGYSAAEILGSNFARFFTAEDIAGGHPEEALRAAALHGHFEEQGWRVRKDGSRFWADVSLTAMRDETGELRGFSKIAHDVSASRAKTRSFRAKKRFAHCWSRLRMPWWSPTRRGPSL